MDTGSDILARDPVTEAFKQDIDRSLLRENLKLTPEARVRKLQAAVSGLLRLREAFGKQAP